MTWRKKIDREPSTLCLVPGWFIEAKRQGAGPEELRDGVYRECLAVLEEQRRANVTDIAEIDRDDVWVTSMLTMFEHAYAPESHE